MKREIKLITAGDGSLKENIIWNSLFLRSDNVYFQLDLNLEKVTYELKGKQIPKYCTVLKTVEPTRRTVKSGSTAERENHLVISHKQ